MILSNIVPYQSGRVCFLTLLTQMKLKKIIMSFKNNNSPGIDNIGPKILKEVCPEIATPLAYLFNLSFSTGVVPDS